MGGEEEILAAPRQPSGPTGSADPNPQPAASSVHAGHELEQRFRAIVLGGLWPLVDVLVRGEPGSLRCSVADGNALVALGLAVPDRLEEEPHGVAGLELTELAVEVQQALAVLRFEGVRPEPTESSAWREILFVAGRPSERGARLLEWLRLGTPHARCYACDAQATGLCDRRYGIERGWVLACSRHRTWPSRWRDGALELHLAGVPSCPSLGEQLRLEEVGRG